LQHAHEHGLIHRDIKPHNVLVHAGNNGRATAKILDFGLARLGVPEGGSGWTQLSSLDQVPANTVLGTPDFVAPEQARDLARADIRADIYSLGATLHYLLTGQVPFPGGSVIEKLLRHNTEEPTPLDHIRTDVPTELAQVVRRMMAKRPDDRYATPCEVARALAPWCEGNRASWETVGPLVPPPLEQETPWGDLWSDTPAPHGELTLTFDDPVAPQRRGLGLALFGVAMFAAGAAAGWFWLG
jgi:serine/threonine protein kinase